MIVIKNSKKRYSSVNSHIQIPNTILKHFRDENDPEKKVWYLDIKTQIIAKKPSSRLGTSKGYYSIDGENYWNSIIEDPIGKLNKQVLSFCTREIKSITFRPRDMDIVKRYIKSAMVRSQLALEAMRNTITNPEMYTEQQLHDALSVIGMTAVEDVAHSLGFDEMVSTILVNRTERNLVVPCNCFYCVLRDNHPNYIMPISPKGALIVLPKKQLQETIGNYGVIDTPEQILRLNKHALKYECMINRAFVASNCFSELEYLQNFLKNPPW